jgi:NADPH2:quinone reductase
MRSGNYARLPALPWTPGTDGAGEVDVPGPGVVGLHRGQRVYVAGVLARRCTGTYAEMVVCDADHVHPLPDAVTFAYRALFQKARLRAGERILVHGASGSVGMAAIQLARAHGAIVIGTAGSEPGRALVSEQGAHFTVDHTAPDHLAQVLDLTGGQGVNVIVEMLASVNLERDFSALAIHGRVVIVGSRGSLEFTPRLTMAKDAVVLGMTLFNTDRHELAEIHAALGAALQAGTLRPIVGVELPLREAARAHRQVLEAGAHGKIVLIP